jgi:6-phosphogluconolactonase (cycloisomerase 2 family)
VKLVESDTPVTIQPKYVFLLDKANEQLVSYRIDLASGNLTEVARVKTGRQPSAIAQDPRNRFVYVANAGSNSVSAYAIDGQSGQLTQVEGSPYPTGKKPIHISVDANGWYLYTLNAQSHDMSAFLIHVTKGQLAEAQGSPLALPKQSSELVTDPTARFVYVNNPANKSINVYRFRTAITPSIFEIKEYGSPFVFDDTPADINIDPTGRFVMVVLKEVNQVAMFYVHVATGALIPIKNNLDPYQLQGKGATDAVFHPSGRFAYVINQQSRSISQLRMERLHGRLSAIAKPIAVNGKPLSMVADPSGHYLYVKIEGHEGLHKYRVDPQNGRLADAGDVALPFSPADMVISRDIH